MDNSEIISNTHLTIYGDANLKVIQDIMIYPYFNLSKKKKIEIRTFMIKDFRENIFNIEVIPDPELGMATIYDYDIILYLISHISKAFENNSQIYKIIRIHRHHLLKSIRRHITGKSYQDLNSSIARLQKTSIKIELFKHTKGKTINYKEFSLIEKNNYISATGELEIHICDWILDFVRKKRLLTISPDYFDLTSPLARKLYLIFRKHAGNQPTGYFISYESLYIKSGSESNKYQFKHCIQNFINEKNNLPEYSLSEGKDINGYVGVYAKHQDFLSLSSSKNPESIIMRKQMLSHIRNNK